LEKTLIVIALYHVGITKQLGTSLDEILHAVLIGLPPAGHKVTQVLPLIVESYQE